MQGVLLLDFDGVVLKNSKAGSYINKRVGEYVRRVVGVQDAKVVDALNREFYTSHGHTLLGLKKHGFDVSLKDFNKHLYSDRSSYKDLCLTNDEKACWDAFRWQMKEQGMKVRLLSNSGIEWMTHFIGYDNNLFEFHDWIDSRYRDSPCYDRILKPERDVYDLVMSKYPKTGYYFVDDKIANFSYLQDDNRWVKIWMYNGDLSHTPIRLGNLFYCVNNLTGVSLLTNGNVEKACSSVEDHAPYSI